MLKVKQTIITTHDLHKLCARAGMTITDLSNKLGKSKQSTFKMAQGKTYVSPDVWETIRLILDANK